MTFLQRLLGIVFFRPAAYRHVASNSSLTIESLLIVIIVAFLNSAVYIWLNGVSLQGIISRFIIPVLIGWLFTGWLSAWIAGMLFKVKIPVSSILRSLGFARIYGLLGIFTILFDSNSAIFYAVALLGAIASVIGIRESGEMSTLQAMGIFLLSLLGTTLVIMPILIAFGFSQQP